jgi:hypothetical protein
VPRELAAIQPFCNWSVRGGAAYMTPVW